MTTTVRPRRRLVLVDHSLTRAGGHSLTAAEAILEGDPLAIVKANASCVISHSRIERVFEHSDMHPSVRFPSVPSGGGLLRFIFHCRVATRLVRANLSFARGLVGKGGPTLWFALNGSIRNAFALIWKCWRTPGDAAVCYILQDPGRSFRIIALLTKLLRIQNFHFAAETAPLAANVSAVSGSRCHVLEFPVLADGVQSAVGTEASQVKAVGGFLGMPRREKGFDILVRAAKILSNEISNGDLALRLQAPPAYLLREGYGEEIMILNQLAAAHSNLTLIEEEIDGPSYRELVAGCDFVIVPYRLAAYSRRSSLVPVEALLHGKPLVITKGLMVLGSLPENAGLVLFEDGDPASLADAIREMAANTAKYRLLAEAIPQEWKNRYDPRNFADAIHKLAGQAR